MKTYNAEIISVGTELLLGQTTNTDSRDVSILLSELGINVLYHTVVGDNPARMAACIEVARGRADMGEAAAALMKPCFISHLPAILIYFPSPQTQKGSRRNTAKWRPGWPRSWRSPG